MSFCKNCITGFHHDGTPEGKWEEINGVNSYVATPSVEYPKDKAILLLTDVFGPQLVNAQLLADDFARNGFKTIVPDYLNGDPVPGDAMSSNPPKIDLQKWLVNHGEEQTLPPLEKVLEGLKEKGITTLGASGFCFGAPYVFHLAFQNIIKASVLNHPSRLQIPADFEKYIKTSKAPLLINSCEIDKAFPADSQAKADEYFGGGKFTHGYKREYFEGCTHGFATRGDMSDPKVKAGKEGAFKATVEWFIKYL